MSDAFAQFRSALADRYTIERELGRGGMALVFLAHDLKHDRPVALKVVRPEFASVIGAERFLREIQLAARLQHPNIVPVHDSGRCDSTLYYVMPYVEGESLRARLTHGVQFPLEDALGITRDVASALGYAHAHGVVHRDIKPENVLLSGGHALVTDFGIARALQGGDEHLTEAGVVVGTPAYMSPEQASGSAVVDERSDIYSLGCVLYEMLAGEPPYTGPSAQAIFAKRCSESPRPIRTLREGIPEPIDRAVQKALAKLPDDRFPTAARFADALVTPWPTRESPQQASVTARVASRRKPALHHVAIGIGLVLLFGAIAMRHWWLPARPPVARATAPLDPRRIAVLYFEDRSQQRDLGYMADGLTEALIRELSRVRPLQVISSNGVAPYRNANVPPDSVGRALSVGTLVQGTVAQSGERLRVSVSLVNAATGAEMGSTTLERARADLFALQDTLAQAVSLFLRETLGEVIQLEEARRETKNVAAWELVQRAEEMRKSVEQLLATADTAAAARELTRADSLLAQAQRMDRSWSRPVVLRGWLAYRRLDLVGTLDKAYYAKWTQEGLKYSDRALRLNPKDADALTLRGTMRYWRYILGLASDSSQASKLLADAESDLRAAVAANAGQAYAWALLSHLLMHKSETAEGRLAALRAYEADPYLTETPVILFRLFSASLDLEDAVEARRWCLEGARRFQKDPRFVECQISLYTLEGEKPDLKKAWRLLQENVALYPPNQRDYRQRRAQLLVAMALARAGLIDSAKAVAVRSRSDTTIDPSRELVYIEVLARNLMGDRDEALRLLATYLAANPQDRASIASDRTWWFRGLRSDPRFKTLVGVGE